MNNTCWWKLRFKRYYFGVWFYIKVSDYLNVKNWLFGVYHWPKAGETTIRVCGWNKTFYYPQQINNKQWILNW